MERKTTPGARARSSGRQRMRPLAYWANERVVYKCDRRGELYVAGVLMRDSADADASPPEPEEPAASPKRAAAVLPKEKKAKRSKRKAESEETGDMEE